jgi:histidinol-phosphatase (PHP family)
MRDGHIHLEGGSYTQEWLEEFIKVALERELTEINLLEHNHRFVEFKECFKSIAAYNEYQENWLKRKMHLCIEEYQEFILACRKKSYPIDIKFGLEVCYIEKEEQAIRDLINGFPWDFVTGSVHWIDGWGFDHKREFWEGRDVDWAYGRYYEIMKKLINSRIFDRVAHPDSIKLFGHKPSYDLSATYEELADLLHASHMSAENNSGLFYRYVHQELGMNPRMLAIFKEKGVAIYTASDAHEPCEVGRHIKEL